MLGVKFAKQVLEAIRNKNVFYACDDTKDWLYYIMYGPLKEFSFDSSGIPYYDYGGSIGVQYSPVTVALVALYIWNKAGGLKAHNEKDISRFLHLADWFLEHAEEHEGNYGWVYHFDWSYYDALLSAPWLSAMGNGLAISVLVRAWLLTRKETYLQSCERALEVFERSVSKGGVRAIDVHGCVWFEEYPIKPEACVLNGFIFALFGLYDLARLGNAPAESLFLEGIETLEKHLKDYDLGYWTAYDLLLIDRDGKILGNTHSVKDSKARRNLGAVNYHAIHTHQAHALYILTKKEVFKQFYSRWYSYYNSFPSLCRFTLHLLRQKISGRLRRRVKATLRRDVPTSGKGR